MSSTEIITIKTENAAELDDAMREARNSGGSVRYWDATSDPANTGWVLRTYDAGGNWTEEAE